MMHQVRDFQLVLCAHIWDGVGECAEQLLKEAVAEERRDGAPLAFFPEPLMICNLRASLQQRREYWANPINPYISS